MGDLPAITLTDPNNRDQAPSPAQSPTKVTNGYDDLAARIATRPETPSNKNGHGVSPLRQEAGGGGVVNADLTEARTDSSSAWPSPGRLMRTRSSHGNAQVVPGARNEEATDEQELSQTIDPLSQHILKRTHTPLNAPSTIPSRPRTSESGNAPRDDVPQQREQSPAPPVQEPLTRIDTVDSITTAHKDLKKGTKAVSFLNRLIGGAKRKELEEVTGDDESTTSEGRPEGNNAEVFKMDNIGFNPRHPQPPAYIKVRSKFKKERDFERLFLAQELQCSSRPPELQRQGSSHKLKRKSSANPSEHHTVWAMEFSRDGKYLAAAGADKIVRVWAVLSSSEDRQNHERQESNDSEANGVDAHAEHLSAPVFQGKPVREYEGHTSTVLDLSWSKNNFLLSSSMDKTVRLWHVSRAECLCTFKHNDFVPSIAFHPKDDRFFLAGSLDSRLRLWSIPDKSVAYSAKLPEMITAVGFTPDGKYAMAGCLSGLCMFYETEGLKYQTQIHVRSTRGQNAKGSKITGIQSQYGATGDVKVLITSNDSRIRLYNFRDKSLELKFRGNQNNCSQIRAVLSDDGRYVVCGSEDRKAYVWSLHQSHGEKRDRTPVEMFEAHNSITTAACLAPFKTRQHLSKSEDPVYDICNPPPVTLLSRAERAESQSSSRPPTENGSIQNTPAEFEKPREPASYVNKTAHKSGHILVTADFTGRIKVFRQDCAWSKRNRDDWDRSSLFGKRSSRMSRTGSLATKTSQRSLRDAARNSTSSAPSERIMSWRQGVGSNASIGEKNSSSFASSKSSRSGSPRRSLDQRSRRSNKSNSGRSAHPLAADALVRSPESMTKKTDSKPSQTDSPQSNGASINKDDDNPLAIQGGRSYLFWDTKVWKGHAERMHHMAEFHDNNPEAPRSPGHSVEGEDGGHLAVQRPGLHKTDTRVSKLSDEVSSVEDDDEFDDAREDNTEHDMRCHNCGSARFSARRVKDHTSLVCTECGEYA